MHLTISKYSQQFIDKKTIFRDTSRLLGKFCTTFLRTSRNALSLTVDKILYREVKIPKHP